jgi:N-acyl-D-amino-acid deacylase
LVHCREFRTILSFKTTMPFDRLPGWARIRSRPLAEQRRAFEDPTLRAQLVDEALHGTYQDGLGAEARRPDFGRMRVMTTVLGEHPSVEDVARQRGVSPVDAIVDLALESDFELLYYQPFANVDMQGVMDVLGHPQAMMALSDTGAHVSQVADGSMPTFLLGHWVRDKGALSLEQAVHELTDKPARMWGFTDRGQVRLGAYADLVVLDPDEVAPGMPEVVRDLPAGGVRLLEKAVGIDLVTCNGRVVQERGRHTDALSGRLVRG